MSYVEILMKLFFIFGVIPFLKEELFCSVALVSVFNNNALNWKLDFLNYW
jgi:hypothetical protein